MVRDTGQPDHTTQLCPTETLKRRADFLRIRGGVRWGTPSFLMESRPRRIADQNDGGVQESHNTARFGYTVTKRQGNAVIRNRMRRRLKEAVRLVGGNYAKPGTDYVLVARAGALHRPFLSLKKDLVEALQQLARPAKPRKRRR